MEAEVIYYCEDHDDVNFSDLLKYFGEPEDIARDFLSEVGISSISNADKKKQHLLNITGILLLVSIALAAIATIYTNYKQQQVLDIHYVEEITYEDDVTPHASNPVYFVETFE